MFEPAFIEHRGVRILRLVYAGLARRELLAAFEAAAAVVRAEPPRSVRILTLMRSSFDAEIADAWKRHGLANAPFVRASAVVATSAFWNVVVASLQIQGREDLVTFADEPSALEWLARA